MTPYGSVEYDPTIITEVESAAPSMQERLEGDFEVPPLTPAEQQLLEAITFPEDVQAGWHERFDDVMQSEIDACITPQDKALMSNVASMLEWEWFAKPGDPLPEGIMLNEHDELFFADDNVEQYRFFIREYLLYCRGYFASDNIGPLNELAVERTLYFDKSGLMDRITQAAGEVVKETPAYAFLRTLVTEAPHAQDVPLSAAQRMIREAQEEDDVRRTYSIGTTESLRMHNDAHRTLQKRLYQLDDERMRAPEQQAADPKKRLMNFIIHELNVFDGYEGDEQIVKIFQDDNGELYGLTRDGRSEFIGDAMYRTSDNWISAVERNGQRRIERYDHSNWLLSRLAYELLDPKSNHLTALQILDKTVLPPQHDLYEMFKDGGMKPGLTAYLHRLDAPIFKVRYTPSKVWWPHESEKDIANVIDADVLAEGSKETIAHIAGNARRDVAGRVVTAARRVEHNQPQHINDYSFMLFVDVEAGNIWRLFSYSAIDSLGCNNIDELEPYIPGYRVAAHDPSDGVWYFKQAEEDPYKGSADVMIEEVHKDTLIERLQNVGMKPMAEELATYADINLAQLVSMLQSHSDYTFDKKYRMYAHHKTELTDDDFMQLIDENGRLQAQCTGAAAFLKSILATALPDSQVISISGHAVNGKGDIADVGHVQVMVSHKGSQYVVDTTPPSRWAGVHAAGSATLATSRENARAVRKNPFAEKREVQGVPLEAEPVTTNLASIRQERAQQARNVVDRSKDLLKAHFNLLPAAPDDELYARILKLKKGADPIRLVMELVLQSEHANEQNGDEIQAAKSYIEAVKDCDERTLKRIGIPRYDGVFLDSLVTILSDVQLKASQDVPIP